MGVLTGFERRLEGAVEGMFARMFKSGLQPIELAQAIQRYVNDHRTVTSSGIDVPNEFRLAINPEDVERLSGYGESLPRELGNVVRETADRRGWNLRGPVVIRTVADDEVPVGRWELVGRVQTPSSAPAKAVVRDRPPAARSPAPTPQPVRDPQPAAASGPIAAPAAPARASAPVAPDLGTPGPVAAPDSPAPGPTPGATQALPPNGIGGARQTSARPPIPDLRLQVVDTGALLDLVTGRYVIGRLVTSDLPIDSTTVSREHAALVKRNDTWWVVDLGSTNGTRVNGIRASEQPVRTGDRIEVGDIDLVARDATGA